MKEFAANDVVLLDGFWRQRQMINAKKAIFHQWEMLESSGCIDNFRIAAGEKEGIREGWFFADSDAFKWLDAAARIERNEHNEELSRTMDEFIRLLGKAQENDGYLFTYNQIHFPGQRWVNLQIEHELYCHGHLIEAGVSHYEATGRKDLLDIARKAADLLVKDFLHQGPEMTPGHEEVEIALLRLWKVTGDSNYLELAKHFLDCRGKTNHFGRQLMRQFRSAGERGKIIKEARKKYGISHPEVLKTRVPAANKAVKPVFIQARYAVSALNGSYFQQHKPIQKQTEPVGHSVRFGYLETAEAMLLRAQPDAELLSTMQRAWERMVTRRMDGTGGIGALPVLEGFGRDYELNPKSAYNETCAALASLMWNWQLTLLTNEAKYADLFEWQLYNAMLVGMGWNGDTYLYNNPTQCRGGITRQTWYSIPCCPSNLSRVIADLGKFIFSYDENELWVHQYISSRSPLSAQPGIALEINSGIPWNGDAVLKVHCSAPTFCKVHLRLPSWAGTVSIKVNGDSLPLLLIPAGNDTTASGVDPRKASYYSITREWREGDKIELEIDLPIHLLQPDIRTRRLHGRTTVTRGPLVYCLENIDNPGFNIFNEKINEDGLHVIEQNSDLNGIKWIRGKTLSGFELTFIPYAFWGNRGPSQMNVWVKH